MLRQVLDIHAQGLVFADGQTSLRSFIGILHQVLDLLVVNFNLGEVDLKLHVFICLGLNSIEDFIAGDGNDSDVGPIPDHRVALACSRLPISEQAAVVPVPSIIEHLLT